MALIATFAPHAPGVEAREAESRRETTARADTLDGARVPSEASFDPPASHMIEPGLNDSASVEGLPVGRIEVVAGNIFDPVPAGRLTFLYRLANGLHVRTRKTTIIQRLPFLQGDIWTESRRRETERALRGLDFLTPKLVRGFREGDSAVVEVVTRDLWSTSLDFNIESAGEKRFGSVSFTESNVLGLGKSVSISHREDQSGKSRSFSYDDGGLLGSRLHFHFGAGDGASGATNQIGASVPFFAQDTPYSYGLSWSRVTSVVRLYQEAREVALLDQRLEETEVFWGRGRRTGNTVRRMEYSFAFMDRRLGPTRSQPGSPPEFEGGEGSLRIRRLAVEGRIWRPGFVERTNVNRMAVIEDFDLGTSLRLKLGMAPEFLGSKADEGFVRLMLDAGARTPKGLGWVRASGSSRIRRQPREALARLDARWIHQPVPRHALVLAALGVGGWHRERDFQAVVGGLNGLRGYPVQAVSGWQLLRFNIEDRWMLSEDIRDVVALGVVAFADAARAWGPGSAGAGWFHSAGTGLRLSLPQWSGDHILRIDVAWPISPTRGGERRAVLSFGSRQGF